MNVGLPKTGNPFLLRETVRMGSLLDMGAGPLIKGKGLFSGAFAVSFREANAD